MRKENMFRKPHFKGDDFPTPRAMTIADVMRVEVFIPNAGAKENRWVVTVREDARYIFLSEALFDNIVTALALEDTDDWAGQAVEFFRVQVSVRGQSRWGVRARKVGQETPQPQKEALPAPITDLTPKRPYPPETLQKGFAMQYKAMPATWKAAALPKGVKIRACIGFKALFPDWNSAEIQAARHALCTYLCDGRERMSADADNPLSWADGKVLIKWLFTGELNEAGFGIPCPLAATEASAILSFVGFFDGQGPPETEEKTSTEAAEEFIDAAVQEAVEMLGATVTEVAPHTEEDK